MKEPRTAEHLPLLGPTFLTPQTLLSPNKADLCLKTPLSNCLLLPETNWPRNLHGVYFLLVCTLPQKHISVGTSLCFRDVLVLPRALLVIASKSFWSEPGTAFPLWALTARHRHGVGHILSSLCSVYLCKCKASEGINNWFPPFSNCVTPSLCTDASFTSSFKWIGKPWREKMLLASLNHNEIRLW